MLTLIRNAQLFGPEPMGVNDLLIADGRIARIAPSIDLAGSGLDVVDAGSRWLVPGIVDALTHPCGGGGEGGYGNRTRELEADDFIAAGVTTPVGALGTDSITRSLDVLYGQVMKLRANGLSALMHSGSYRVPPASLTGDLARDLLLVAPVIGVGEVAIADHRSSHPAASELLRLASDIHLGGTLSGKGGTVFLHVGDEKDGLALVEKVLGMGDLPRALFYPTHCNRNTGLLNQAIDHVRRGGFADFTVSTTPELVAAGETPALDALRIAIDAGAPADRLSFSSDAGGSLPLYENGKLRGVQTAGPGALLELLRAATTGEAAPPVDVIAALTRNPADALKLPGKGRIAVGADADLLLLDPAGVGLTDVFSLGRRLMRHGQIQSLSTQAHERGAHHETERNAVRK